MLVVCGRSCAQLAKDASNTFAEARALLVPEEPSTEPVAPSRQQDLFDDDELDTGSAVPVRGCVLQL